MNPLISTIGAALVLVTTVDIFLTVLFPASRRGPVRKPVSAAVWQAFRLVGGALGGSRRRQLLAFTGPVVILATLVAWFALLTLGFALVFEPALGRGVASSGGTTKTGLATALYYAGFNLTTLGIGDIAPRTAAWRLATVGAAALGFGYFSMAITYFVSVYGNLTGRNAFAQALHHLTDRTGDAAVLIAAVGAGGELSAATGAIAQQADALRRAYQAHRFYPVLRHFHYPEPAYALPRILLICLDATALMRAALDPDRAGRLMGPVGAGQLLAAARDLLDDLNQDTKPAPPTPEQADAWRRRYAMALPRLRRAGLPLREDAAAGAEAYLAARAEWNQPLVELADAMLCEWSVVEPSRRSDAAF